MDLSDKVAIVTGAGTGIGKAIALAFAREGANLIVVSRTFSEVEETARCIEAMGRHAISLKVDVTDSRDVTGMVDVAIKKFGTVNMLVNNAGVQGPLGAVVENDVHEWIQTLHVNLVGVFLCTRAVLPTMMQQRSGKIINLSGGGAASARPYFTAYAASKAAVVRFTESVAHEVKDYNIQVNAIAPGAVNTRMVHQVLAAGQAAGEEELAVAMRQVNSGGNSPEKAAALAVFLASERSDGLTGRLISAVWDSWQDMRIEDIIHIMNSDLYTLRRLVKGGKQP